MMTNKNDVILPHRFVHMYIRYAMRDPHTENYKFALIEVGTSDNETKIDTTIKTVQ